MNEQAYQREMDDQAQFEAEQYALRGEMLDKQDEFKPLFEEMIADSAMYDNMSRFEHLIDLENKLGEHIRSDEYQQAIDLMNRIMEV